LPSTKVHKIANVTSPEPFIFKEIHKFLALRILACKLVLSKLKNPSFGGSFGNNGSNYRPKKVDKI